MTLLLSLILLCGVLFLALFLYLRYLHLVVYPELIQAPHVVPSEPPSAFWGSLSPLQKWTGSQDIFLQYHGAYLKNPDAKVTRVHILFLPGVLLFDPKLIKRVISLEDYPKSSFYDTFSQFFGDGLVFSSGSKWAIHRKLLNAGFGPLYLRQLVPSFVDYTRVWIDTVKATPGMSYDLGDNLQKLAMDIIAGAGFGYSLRSVEGKAPPVEKSFALLLSLSANPLIFISLTREFLKFYHRKAIGLIDEVIFKSIEEKQQRKDTSSRKDILDLLLTSSGDEKLLSKEEIRDELVTFFIAGHETTALTITWAIYLLNKNPSCMERLLKEIDEILLDPNQLDAPPRDPKAEDFPHFKYLTMVLKETLRLYPPAAGLTRRTPEDVEFDGHFVKKGQTVFLPIYTLQRDPSLWENPDQFDPERWNEDNIATSSANFYAFSHGSRNCIGQQFFWNEAKVIVPMLLSNFKVIVENTDELVPTDKTGTLKPTTPFIVKLEKRVW